MPNGIPEGGVALRGLAAGGFLLGMCACVDPASVRATPPPEDTFRHGLYSGYLDLADSHAAAGESFSASFYAYKARAAARGEPVSPERLDDWELPEARRPVLLVARARLMASIAQGQRRLGADHAAQAQVMFDCWIVREETAGRTTPVDSCRQPFWNALANLDQALERR